MKLVQPERLLDSLTESYRRPRELQEVNLKARLGEELLTKLKEEAMRARARIADFSGTCSAPRSEPSRCRTRRAGSPPWPPGPPDQRSSTGGMSCGSAPGQVNLTPGAQTTGNQSYNWKEPGDRSGPLTRQSPPR